MRRVGLLLLGAGVVGLAGCNRHPTPPPSSAKIEPHRTPSLSTPRRKPGFWSMRVSGPAGDQASWLCIDEATDAKVSLWASPVSPDHCPSVVMHQAPDGSWAFASFCDRGANGRERAAGTASGDFQTKYRVDATTTITGAKGEELNGVRHFTVAAEYEGACPAGMKPGTLQTAGGAVDLLDVR